jgi:hypothetical protein
MKMPSGKAQKINSQSTVEKFREKLLAANFTIFPGDVGKFDDESLQREGFLDQFRKFEKELEKQSVFDDLEAGLMAADLRPAAIRDTYRWFCLAHLQNKLRLAEIERLKQELNENYKEMWELRDQLSEGTAGFWVVAAILGRDLSKRRNRFASNTGSGRNGKRRKRANGTLKPLSGNANGVEVLPHLPKILTGPGHTLNRST